MNRSLEGNNTLCNVPEHVTGEVCVPSPDEIRTACLEIQKGWTETERARRARGLAGRIREKLVARSRFGRMSIHPSPAIG